MINPRKILIIDLNLLGDTIVFLPTLINVRKSWPDAQLTYITTRMGKEITEDLNLIDQIWTTSHSDIKKLFNFIHWLWAIRKEKFDLVLTSCDTPSRVALMLFLSGIPTRVGFTNAKSNWFYNHRVSYSRSCHQAELNLQSLKCLGQSTELVKPELRINDSDRKVVDSLLKEKNIGPADLLISIHPGSKRLSRRWSLERFGELANHLIDRYNAKIVCIGSNQEKDLSGSLRSLIKKKNYFIDMVGQTTVKQLACLIQQCAVLICHSTGPFHLAVLLGVPTVSLWGASSQIVWGPLWDKEKHQLIHAGLDCLECEKVECPKNTLECMKLITVDMVLKETSKTLQT